MPDYTLQEEARVRVRALLNLITKETRPCVKCGRQIWMVAMHTGKLMPVSDDGVSHFADCPNAADFRRAK